MLPALLSLSLPAFPATNLVLHKGSSRDWVKRFGASGDSVRYHLEFLDSTSRDSSSNEEVYNSASIRYKADTTIDWRVRITRSDSPAVADTAILRVLRSRWVTITDSLLDVEERRIQGIAFWLKPSRHFPIDLQFHSSGESSFPDMRIDLTTGVWEALLLAYPKTTTGTEWNRRNDLLGRQGDKFCTTSLDGGSCYDVPTVASRDSLGIVAWQNNGAIWELRGVDGSARPPLRGSLGHALRKGECWVYRDSSESDYLNFNVRSTSRSRAFVSLELLSTPSDSTGWMRLLVRQSVHPDSGASSDTTYAILLDTLRTIVRIGTFETTPENLSSGVPGWALGLMKHPLFPNASKSSYRKSFSHSEGEAVAISSSSYSYLMSLDYGIGATSISSQSSTSGVGSIRGSGFSCWTLVTHSLDNAPLANLAAPARPTRDIAWLRARIAQDPTLNVARVRMDGRRTVARGAAATRLLQERGMAIVQARDGRELVTLRVANP